MKVTTKIELNWEDIARCIYNEMKDDGWEIDEKTMKYKVNKNYEISITVEAERED